MARTNRQLKLLDIISREEIETQEALAEALRKEGVNVTQATISRDIKELGLIKVMTPSRGYKYAQPQPAEHKASSKLLALFREAVISVDSAGNLVVIKTLSGGANAAAELVDKMHLPEVIGTIAGDNAILVIVKSEDKVDALVEKLKSLML